MTSNERKIINFLRDAKEKTHIRLIAKKTNFSSDYTQSLCHSLARAGYIKLEDSNVCHLLKKGQGHFESVAVMREVSEPVVVTANVTLLTDEPAGTPIAGDRDDKTDDDAELDKALADLEPSSQKEGGEKIDEPEEPEKTESAEEAEGKEEQREEEILAKPAIEEEKTKSPGAATEPKEEAVEKEEAIELEPQATAEPTETKEEVKTEAQETGTTETKPADNPAPTAPLESSEKTAAMKKEEKQEKGDATKSSNGSGWSFKKIVNWFAEKK